MAVAIAMPIAIVCSFFVSLLVWVSSGAAVGVVQRTIDCTV